jgi:murein DD-endopeptidase MepM/ murein hydrolase activator NlpD
LAQHRSSRSSDLGAPTNGSVRCADPSAAEITDIIPFNEFGDLDDLQFRFNSAFDTEAEVLHAPELDDLNDITEPTPLRLVVPREFRDDVSQGRHRSERDRHGSNAWDGYGWDADVLGTDAEITDVVPIRRGHHRKPAMTAEAVKGRLLIAAMATGAAAAAAHSATHTSAAHSSQAVLAADESALPGGSVDSSKGVQLINVTPTVDKELAGEELANGVAFAQDRAQREARLERPLYVMPTVGVPTSPFGYRWGVLHGGIDLANAIGTPILAVADGVVIDAGPAAGFGLWVKLRHADGTVTVYGHVNTINCRIGQRVMAGDEIATMGNRGNSTGPHLHFEVQLNGTQRVDPVPWLAARGLKVGGFTG